MEPQGQNPVRFSGNAWRDEYEGLLFYAAFTPVDSREADGRWDGNYGPGMAKAVGAFIAANGGPDTFPGEGPDTIGPIMRAALISNTS